MSTILMNPASDPEQRKLGIGGSDMAAILGLSPYKTPLDVYLEKRGLWDDPHESEAMHWGNVMEPVLAREYVRRFETPVLRREPNIGDVALYPDYEIVQNPAEPWKILGTLTHPKYEWARGHLDGVGLSEAGDPSHVCEFKTADSRLGMHWGEPDSDEIPESYLVQCQWYLMLAALEVAHVAVLIGGNRFQRHILPRNQKLIDLMLERAAEFWQRVQTQNPPAPEPNERGAESLKRLYPKGMLGKEIEATPDLILRVEELHRLRVEEKAVKEAKTAIEVDLKAIMADAVRLNLGPGAYIGYANNKDSEKVDWEAVAKAAGASAGLIASHTTTKPGARVFRPTGLEKLFR